MSGLGIECMHCKRIIDADEYGMSLKCLDRAGNKLLCFECMAKETGASVHYLKEKVEFLREHGCTLFPPKK